MDERLDTTVRYRPRNPLDMEEHVMDSGPMQTSEVPDGCGALWNAAAPGVDPDAMTYRAVQAANLTGQPQAVRLPSGQIVVVSSVAA